MPSILDWLFPKIAVEPGLPKVRVNAEDHNRWVTFLMERGWSAQDFVVSGPVPCNQSARVVVRLRANDRCRAFPVESWPEDAISALEDGCFAEQSRVAVAKE